MNIPKSMKSELGAWNNGEGIDLEAWVGCEGSFSLAVGYAAIFWPEIVEYRGYVLRKGFSRKALADFEKQEGATRGSIERVMNHLHIADLQYVGCDDISKDKLVVLGNVLKDIYEVRLKVQFPKRPCIVEFFKPKNREELFGYQILFWQRRDQDIE
jgi:hypothetical protein